jgi:Sigma-70 region 2
MTASSSGAKFGEMLLPLLLLADACPGDGSSSHRQGLTPEHAANIYDYDRKSRFIPGIIPFCHNGNKKEASPVQSDGTFRDAHGAEDLVQEAFLRAWRFFDNFDGINGRVWLLAIVRNTCYSWLRKHGGRELTSDFTQEAHAVPGNAARPALECLEDRTGGPAQSCEKSEISEISTCHAGNSPFVKAKRCS